MLICLTSCLRRINAYTVHAYCNIVYVSDIRMYFQIYLEKVTSGVWSTLDRSNAKTNSESYFISKNIVHLNVGAGNLHIAYKLTQIYFEDRWTAVAEASHGAGEQQNYANNEHINIL